MHLTLVGLSHKTAPIETREKLTFPAERQEEALSILTSTDSVAEAVILSTCNRTEIYAVVTSEGAGKEAIIGFLADYHGLDRHELIRYLYLVDGSTAVRTPVTYGAVTEQYVQIISGVSAGDEVITSSYQNYIDFGRVELEDVND